MTSDELKNILPELQETDVSCLGLEDMLCSAYIYDALYNLVSVNGLDQEYGDRKIYGGKIRQLFELLTGMYGDMESVLEQGKILALTGYLIGNSMAVCNREFVDRHNVLADKFISENAGKLLSGSFGNDFESEKVVYFFARVVLDYICFCREQYRELDAAVSELLDRWASTVEDDGKWDGVTAVQALCRIDLMRMYSALFLDFSREDKIRAAESAYLSQSYCDDIPDRARFCLEVRSVCDAVCGEIQQTVIEEN